MKEGSTPRHTDTTFAVAEKQSEGSVVAVSKEENTLDEKREDRDEFSVCNPDCCDTLGRIGAASREGCWVLAAMVSGNIDYYGHPQSRCSGRLFGITLLVPSSK